MEPLEPSLSTASRNSKGAPSASPTAMPTREPIDLSACGTLQADSISVRFASMGTPVNGEYSSKQRALSRESCSEMSSFCERTVSSRNIKWCEACWAALKRSEATSPPAGAPSSAKRAQASCAGMSLRSPKSMPAAAKRGETLANPCEELAELCGGEGSTGFTGNSRELEAFTEGCSPRSGCEAVWMMPPSPGPRLKHIAQRQKLQGFGLCLHSYRTDRGRMSSPQPPQTRFEPEYPKQPFRGWQQTSSWGCTGERPAGERPVASTGEAGAAS
mmetsp:Transcript_114997/g.366940  ORF Transcript_114997/g.366940 Transcript_114997/m.366940 type:complete len:273 (+) Transcript_114997:1062-1880(+)